MFEKDDKDIRLAMSTSAEQDRQINRDSELAAEDHLRRLAKNPDAVLRKAAGF
jgi:hypothetical protein